MLMKVAPKSICFEKLVTVANIIANKGKPYSDGEFANECLENMVKICSERKKLEKVSSSRQTMSRRLDEIRRFISNTEKLDRRSRNSNVYLWC